MQDSFLAASIYLALLQIPGTPPCADILYPGTHRGAAGVITSGNSHVFNPIVLRASLNLVKLWAKLMKGAAAASSLFCSACQSLIVVGSLCSADQGSSKRAQKKKGKAKYFSFAVLLGRS